MHLIKVLYSAMILNVIPVFVTLLSATPPYTCANEVAADITDICSNCTEYTFDGSRYTITTEWNLVCNKEELIALPDSFFMVGHAVSSFFGFPIVDILGRQRTMLIAMSVQSLIMMSQGFARDIWTFRKLFNLHPDSLHQVL